MAKVTVSKSTRGKPIKPPPIEPPVEPPAGDPVSGTFKGMVTPTGGVTKEVEGEYSGTANAETGEFNVMGTLFGTVLVPVISVAPTLSPASASVGALLICTTGTWTNTPTSYAYQWMRGGIDISGATSSTYTTQVADDGTTLTCKVRAANTAGNAVAYVATSNSCVVSSAGVAGWQVLKIGAGGYCTGGDIAPDGTIVSRNDTYGAYRWDVALDTWVQLVTTVSMPAVVAGKGCYELRIAPSNSNIFYMIYDGHFYRSIDKGVTWVDKGWTNFTEGAIANTFPIKAYGSKMAVDPSNSDIVIAGTPNNGIRRTTNGGTSWTTIASVPVSATANAGHNVLFIDSNNVLVTSFGNGVYLSTNGGVSFTLSSASIPGVFNWAKAIDGIVYACVSPGGVDNVWKYAAGSWTQLTGTAGGYWSVVCDPADATHVTLFGDGGMNSEYSFDRGATWSGQFQAVYPATIKVESSSDIPWIEIAENTGAGGTANFLTNGNTVHHPSNGRVYLFMGTGVMWTVHPITYSASSHIVWQTMSRGIEQMVANAAIPVPSGGWVLGLWDRAVFKIPSANASFPADHGPNHDNAIIHCWSLDYATSDPTFVVALINYYGAQESAWSADQGQTWTTFTAVPFDSGNKHGGCIAATTPDNIIFVQSNEGLAYRTSNRGATWTAISIAGTPGAPPTGWGGAFYQNRQIVAADRVTANKFYLYNGATDKVYNSTDNGVNWSAGGVTGIVDSGLVRLKTVPGTAGLLLMAPGQYDVGLPASAAMRKSTDSGTSWANVPNVTEVYDIGFGKAGSSGSDYAGCTVFIVGKVSGVYGVHYSTNINQATPTWTKIGDYPNNSFDFVKCISGESTVFGMCCVGFLGSSFAMYRP